MTYFVINRLYAYNDYKYMYILGRCNQKVYPNFFKYINYFVARVSIHLYPNPISALLGKNMSRRSFVILRRPNQKRI